MRAQVAPGDAAGTSGVCNAALPNSSTYARFLWVVKFLTANGFYVLIDNHLSYDDTAVTNPTQACGPAAGPLFHPPILLYTEAPSPTQARNRRRWALVSSFLSVYTWRGLTPTQARDRRRRAFVPPLFLS